MIARITSFFGNFFDSAGTEKNSFTNWNPPQGLTGDDENIESQKPISARVHDLIRNNSTANSLLSTLGNGVIGTGLKVLPQIDHKTLGISKEEAKEKGKELLRYFNLWATSEYSTTDRKNNYYMLQMRLFKNQCLGGDSFVILRNNSQIHKTKKFSFDLTCEGVDSGMCCNPVNVQNTPRLAGGIETNIYNEEIAYHFKKIDQDMPYYNNFVYETTRILKHGQRSGRRNVIHIHTPLRFSERRGVSMFAPLVEAIKQMDRYEKSELMATVISSYFTAFVKTQNGEEIASGKDPYGRPTMGSGNLTYLNEGEDITLASSNRPNPNFAAFEDAYWTKFTSAMGMSGELTKIKYDTSYTAARAALQTTYKNFLIRRMEFNFECNQPIYEEFVNELVLRKIIELPGYLTDPLKKQAWLKTSWIGDAMMTLDPVKEATAAKLLRQEGIKSSNQNNLEITGRTYEETIDQMQEEKELREEKEMLFPDEYERETKRFDAQRKIDNLERVEETTGDNENEN